MEGFEDTWQSEARESVFAKKHAPAEKALDEAMQGEAHGSVFAKIPNADAAEMLPAGRLCQEKSRFKLHR